jgi:tRNA nucleotidyltransferase (CCA-adding enzyme)
MLMLAVLAHDFGKPATTVRAERRGVMRWTSPGHEGAGGPIAEGFLRRIGAPLELDPPVKALVIYHLAHHHGQEGEFSDSQIRRLARKLSPATIDDLALVMTADSLGRPPKESPETAVLIAQLRLRSRELEVRMAAPRPLILGRHLVALGWKPGPDFKGALAAAFEAQLDGAFLTEAGGIEWLKHRLNIDRGPKV